MTNVFPPTPIVIIVFFPFAGADYWRWRWRRAEGSGEEPAGGVCRPVRDRRGLFPSGEESWLCSPTATLQLLQNWDAHPLVLVLSAVQDVINVSKKYLPGMAKGFFSPKLTLHVGDGFEFMKQNQDAFDVIITDSSDPVGKRFLRSLVYRLVASGACR